MNEDRLLEKIERVLENGIDEMLGEIRTLVSEERNPEREIKDGETYRGVTFYKLSNGRWTAWTDGNSFIETKREYCSSIDCEKLTRAEIEKYWDI
jgi:hypothetical protein